MSVLKPPSVVDLEEYRAREPRILRAGQDSVLEEEEAIPFVPAFDLLEAQEKRLKPEEIAAVALALHLQLPQPDAVPSAWALSARLSGLSKRM